MVGAWCAEKWLWACVSVALGAGCAHHHHGCAGHGAQTAGGVYVSGTGEAKAKPDVARTNVGIEVRAPSAQQATEQANAQMTELIKLLKAQGIADADLRTQGFSVSYDRDYVPPQPLEEPAAPVPLPAPKSGAKPGAAPRTEIAPAQPAPAPAARGSYVVSNMVEVTLRDIARLGQLLGSLTSAGANNIWGISFDIDDKRPLIEQARANAFERAKADAARVAELSGVKLGRIVEVSDAPVGATMHPERLGGAMRAQAMDVPVERGELTITHQVSLRYAIVPADHHGAHAEQ